MVGVLLLMMVVYSKGLKEDWVLLYSQHQSPTHVSRRNAAWYVAPSTPEERPSAPHFYI